MTTRIVPDMLFADYAAAPGINATALKIVHQQSLAHAKAHLDGRFQKESAALDFGRAFHSLALEDKIEFAIRPDVYPTKEGDKPWNGNATFCKDWLAAQDGALVINRTNYETLSDMRGAVKPYLSFQHGCQCEISVFSEREGLPVKVRVDCLPGGEDQPVVDLKTCRSAHPEQFMRDALRMGYHIQAAYTLDLLAKAGIKRKEFRFIAVETEAPYAVCVLRFQDIGMSALRMGRARYRAIFNRIAEAHRTGRWEGYGETMAEDYIPAWYAKELEQTA